MKILRLFELFVNFHVIISWSISKNSFRDKCINALAYAAERIFEVVEEMI